MSEDTDDSQKTEEPTQKKLLETRKRGQVPLSREINNWLMLFTGTIVIVTLGPSVLSALRNHLRTYIEQSHALPTAPGGLGMVFGDSVLGILGIMALPLMIFMAAAFLGPFLQDGPLFAPEAIKPKLEKISPLKGFKRLFSARSMMEFAKGILKITIIGLVGFLLLRPYYGRVDSVIGLPIPILLEELLGLVLRMMAGVLVVLIVVAVIDLAFQRQQHHKQMRMTKQELKDEYRQTEGDPHVRAKLRQLRQQRARMRMLQAVPQADVVITNPTHYAIALKYNPEKMDAPLCIAKGVDDVALRIREMAKGNKIEIVENPPLARALYDSVDIEETIPAEHYRAVAEIISFVFRKQGKLKPKTS